MFQMLPDSFICNIVYMFLRYLQSSWSIVILLYAILMNRALVGSFWLIRISEVLSHCGYASPDPIILTYFILCDLFCFQTTPAFLVVRFWSWIHWSKKIQPGWGKRISWLHRWFSCGPGTAPASATFVETPAVSSTLWSARSCILL